MRDSPKLYPITGPNHQKYKDNGKFTLSFINSTIMERLNPYMQP